MSVHRQHQRLPSTRWFLRPQPCVRRVGIRLETWIGFGGRDVAPAGWALLLIGPLTLLVAGLLAAWPARQAARLRLGDVLRAE